MKKLILHIALFFSWICFSQNEQLAQYYYEKGDFEKAKLGYEELLKSSPQNSQYFQRTVDCYQQLQQYDLAEKTIQNRLSRYKQGFLLVDLGYNYQLQKNESKAKNYYEQALESIKSNPNEVYGVANSFEKKVLLDYAVKAYQMAADIEPNFNFNYQLALLYGQLGKTDLMITTFLDEAFINPQNVNLIQHQISRYMSDEADVTFSYALRKELILRTQKNQDVFWNQFLSWFYMQQKEFGKAFVQEKAIYKRQQESLNDIVNLGQMAIEENQTEAATEILTFVLENTMDLDILIKANTYLIEMQLTKIKPAEYPAMEAKLNSVLQQFEINPFTVKLQLIQANFTAFLLKKPAEARAIIDRALQLPINDFQKAEAKMALADILLFEEKYNQALLYYSQVELEVKNDVLAHEASLMAAKTSYFKTDFEWALKQFKTLKSANTQLIANDALEYFLLINDNTVADSTQTALKQFAKGDYLMYQKRTEEAISYFENMLKQFKGQEIEAVTLLRLGKLYESVGNYTQSLNQYQAIITQHSECIYMDEALFFAAELYVNYLKDPEKAKPLYEKIIFNHQDSIFYVEARKKFRLLRGDQLAP